MACNLRPTPARTQQEASIPGGNAGERSSRKDEVMEIPTGSNSGRQGVDKSTEPTFDGQKAGDNMDIDDNDRFEELEEDPPSGDGQGQNQGAD